MSIKNPFSPANQGEMKLKRNAYNLSRSSLFSTKFGRLNPAFIEEVIPGDSFEISGSLAVQGMPTVFPLQTKCRVSMELYYCRNRCVWDEFEDFIFNTKEVEQPWLRLTPERAKQMISTGSIGDFFGIPSTFVSDSPVYETIRLDDYGYFRTLEINWTSSRNLHNIGLKVANIMQSSTPFVVGGQSIRFQADFIGYNSDPLNFPIHNNFSCSPFISVPSVYEDPSSLLFLIVDSNNVPLTVPVSCNLNVRFVHERYVLDYEVSSDLNLFEFTSDLISRNISYRIVVGSYLDHEESNSFSLSPTTFFPSAPTSETLVPSSFNFLFRTQGVVDATDDSVIGSNPFVGSTPQIKVNALPYRHLEMISNYYYRNDKNNPYVLDGEPQYNKFIPTKASGADDNVYDFHYRNWELDRFTSAVQSPQFGEAPLVGLTFTGAKTAQLTFQDATDPNKTYTATVGVDDDDKVVTIDDFSQDIPSANLRKLQSDMQSQYGLSINDLRVGNSFQRFLENKLRRGLRYRNELKSHHGVSVDYPDIDIPQYIGGFSGEMTVGKVTNMAQTAEAPLGDFNGSLSGVISSGHPIRCYCPEHGFIIGVVSITPVPVYSQTTRKCMIKNSPFDYYLPEFSKIGFVPMHYDEVMPLQTPFGGSVDDVFGYQKAWYDYMLSYDEAHGYFRTNLKDFLVQRVFAERPELVQDFTTINPDQLTDVFVATDIQDKYGVDDRFLCNLAMHVVVKRQIPRIGTPSLE